MKSAILCQLATVLVCATAFGGDLSPLAGPVPPTLRPLNPVEPRTPIGPLTTPGDDDSVFRIALPGSYYLTRNVSGLEGKNGIEIAASHVSIDMMGFVLHGRSTGLAGVVLDGQCDHLTLRNGSITEWTTQGLNLAVGGGEGRILEDLHCAANGAQGMLTGQAAIVVNCSAIMNDGDGILSGQASSLENCSARLNGGTGIIVLGAGVARGCSSWENNFGGYYIEQGGSIESSSAQQNPLGGIFARNGTRVTNCLARDNFGDGINAGDECIIIGNTVTRNEGDGIETDGDSLVKDNVVSFNRTEAGDGAGIRVRFHGSRIEGNHLRVNDFGLNIMHTHNLIIRNSAVSNTMNYRIVPSNRVGTIIPAPGTTSMIEGDSGGGLGTTDPWANFAY
jgi:hypothetical protein